MKKIQLANFIKQAFNENVYPGDDDIVCNNSQSHIDCWELREQLRGKAWNQLSIQCLQEIKNETAFFSEKGLHYYLPAFMLFVIDNFTKADTLTHDIVSRLTLPTEMDVVTTANKIKTLKLDTQLTQFDFGEFLTNQLDDINDNAKRFIRFGSLFKHEQGKSVRVFLKYLTENHMADYTFETITPQVALDRYWFIFE